MTTKVALWIGEPLQHLPVDTMIPENKDLSRSAVKISDVLIDVNKLLAQTGGDASLSLGEDGLKNRLVREVSIDVDYLLAKIASSPPSNTSNYSAKDLHQVKKDRDGSQKKIESHDISINIDELLARTELGRRANKFTSCSTNLTQKRFGSASRMDHNNMVY